MLLLNLLSTLLPVLLVSATQLDQPNLFLNNRDIYDPSSSALQRRLSTDLPGINPNVTYINPYSKPHTTGLTDEVAWDRYSLYVRGQRLFIYSGEFHPFRLPVPALWKDILIKSKAAGSNAVSIYVPWHLSNPSEGVIDFDGFRDLQLFFDYAMEIGLWVIARPGPFINAETTGGGIPAWAVRKGGDLRTNATDYTESWQQYIHDVVDIIARNQISSGGPVVLVQLENEFSTGPVYNPHMQLLKDAFLVGGIVVPLTHNNAQGRGQWSVGEGSVDIAAIDAYPAGFSCLRPQNFAPLVAAFNLWSERVNRDAPYYFAEVQGGSFNPWGSTVGYESCYNLTNDEFERVQSQYMLEVRVTMINKYMWYGGTNWGLTAAPVVYTSYDYGTHVSEERRLTDKYSQYKLLGLFLRNAPEFRQTEVVGYFGEFSQYSFKTQPYIGRPARNGTAYTSDSGLWTTELRNPLSLSAFYLLRQATWEASISSDFVRSSTLSIWSPDTSDLTIPQFGSLISIGGRDSRIIPVDLFFGSSHLRYSTAAVLISTALGESKDLLVVYGEVGQAFELVLAGLGSINSTSTGTQANITSFDHDGDLAVTFFVESFPTHASLEIGSLTLVIVDTQTAYRTWQPTLENADAGAFGHFAEVGTNSSAVVVGPYLVRNASVEDGELALWGDVEEETEVVVYATEGVTSVTWGGEKIETYETLGGLGFHLAGPESFNLTLPELTSWKYADSLPEKERYFDDSTWRTADVYNSNATIKPANGTPSLSATDYGFVGGNILFRGYFDSAVPTSVSLNVTGGAAFAFAAYLNGDFLGYAESKNGSDTYFKAATFDIPSGLLQDRSNALLILQDHMGLDEGRHTDLGSKASKNNRGILSAVLNSPSNTTSTDFTLWKVQGNFGGETKFPDRVRGLLNEGGLYGERMGWHLPGFDDSEWNSTSSIAIDGPGVGFFRTELDLDVQDGMDVPLRFDFGSLGGAYRCQLYVNGWQYGRFVSSVGPQVSFPVPEGILDYHGTNTVAVSLWSYGSNATDLAVPSFTITSGKVLKGGVGRVSINNPPWSARG